jgi:hypothetical protein
MSELHELDVAIGRIDRAVARATAAPSDPLATYELCLCLDLLDRLGRSGLGAHIDRLIGEAAELVRECRGALPTHTHPLWAPRPTAGEAAAGERLRCKLLDLAAAISVLNRD